MKQTLLGSGLGLVATVSVHLLGLLLFGLLLTVGLKATGAVVGDLVTPELAEAGGLLAALSIFLALPVLILGGATAVVYIVEVLLPLTAGLILLLGLASGSLTGYYYQRPLLQERPYLFGLLLGLSLNLLALTILALLTTKWMFIMLPGYVCLGPAVGGLAVFLIRRTFSRLS